MNTLTYGNSLTFAQAQAVAAAAREEAAKHGVAVIAVVDAGGHLVLLERMDGAQFGSIEVARAKAYSAVAYKRDGKVFEDLLAQGGLHNRVLALEGAMPFEGGAVIVVDGKVVGGVGVSGMPSQFDELAAQAGARVVSGGLA